MKDVSQSVVIHGIVVIPSMIPTIKCTSLFLLCWLTFALGQDHHTILHQASRMLYSSSVEIEKGGGIPLISLFLPLVTFFVSYTTVISVFLLSRFQDCLGALVACVVELLKGFLTDMLVLLDASTSLMKLVICKFSK